MDTKQIIDASATVVTITSFRPGDVYKRVEDAYSEPTLRFGVVQDVMHNGTEGAFTALEYRSDYSGLTIEMKVYNGGKPAALYAATPDEVRSHVADLVKACERKERDASKAYDTATEMVARARQIAEQANDMDALRAPVVVAGAVTA